ncbi:modulator protein [Salmonella enterica]|nr:modulator protein [Salmonella enterica]EIY3492774.1 modulator protein [Salmonella enterica]
MKKRYYPVKHGTLRMLQEYADPFSVEVRRVGVNKGFQIYRRDGEWRTVVDFSDNSIPLAIRDRTHAEWERIITDNVLLLLSDE